MIYTDNNLILMEDSLDNLYSFFLNNGNISSYYFEREKNKVREKKISEGILKDYDVSIDDKDNIFIVFQDKNYHLVLMVIEKENTKKIILTEEPIPEVFNLNIKILNNKPHIFYCVLLEDLKYRIIHHYYNGKDWTTNIVEDIKVNQILNPVKILKDKEGLKLIYYNKKKTEEIYCKNFSFKRWKWENSVKLTENPTIKLYLDSLIIGEDLHLVYCQYEKNLVVKYERYNCNNNIIIKEIDMELSNRENIRWPILIYYEGSLWVVWVEYENIISRFSLDNGNTWSPIYLWQGIKNKDIVLYKYITNKKNRNLLNNSFGTIGNNINFVGFGTLDNAIEIPLKKKKSLSYRRL